MRILYIDIDSLRPDHLGCYGYQRNTSPNIDALAARGVRFEHVYASDAPCLPSRTALWSGKFGFHNGVVDHGGPASQPFPEPGRGFRDSLGTNSWMAVLQRLGYRTATVSSFGERHSAWHWYAGYHEIFNCGLSGMERADQVLPAALEWLERRGREEDWFLHVNLWDPHTPYRTPPDYPNHFTDDPLPAHLTEEYWRQSWNGYGPHSPQELNGFQEQVPYIQGWNAPDQLDSFEAVRWWIDHYDMGIRYADDHIGLLLARLAELGILDDTLIMVSADHGENQGELNVWGDHQTADAITCRVPLIVVPPASWQVGPRVDAGLHYHFDWAATLIELAGGQIPADWDAVPFTTAFRTAESQGREYLVTSQGAWSCQRGVRFDFQGKAYLMLRTYHDGYKMLDALMLFDLHQDPHEQHNLAAEAPQIVQHGLAYLEDWWQTMMRTSRTDVDPLMRVLRQGGAFHTRGELPAYLEHLRRTGREAHAETLASKHAGELRT